MSSYFLFLNSLVPSISVMYSNPFSISCVASLMLLAVLQWYSSFSRVSSSWVYRNVVLRSLCPSMALTCSRSLVLWYSIVALKCLKSYSRMLLKVGSCSFSANLFLGLRYCSLILSDLHLNSLSFAFRCFFRMYCFSISKVFGLSFPTLPTVCLAPVMLVTPFCRLMSETFSHVSSMGRVPKSFDIESINAIRGDAFDISMSIFSSVGIFGSLSYQL